MHHRQSPLYAILHRLLPGRLKVLAIRFDRSPIATRTALAEFLSTRSAYVAQTTFYGYLKTRMGTQFASLFQDETYVASINAVKWPIFGSCLADLTIYASALTARETSMATDAAQQLAADLYARAVEHGFAEEFLDSEGAKVIAAFEHRIAITDWKAAAEGENAFGRSPYDLVKYAPVSDEYRQLDGEIVRNSMRFRWTDVRRQLAIRLYPKAIACDGVLHDDRAMDTPK